MAAANNGRYGTADILLSRGANPDRQDNVSSCSASFPIEMTNVMSIYRVIGQH